MIPVLPKHRLFYATTGSLGLLSISNLADGRQCRHIFNTTHPVLVHIQTGPTPCPTFRQCCWPLNQSSMVKIRPVVSENSIVAYGSTIKNNKLIIKNIKKTLAKYTACQAGMPGGLKKIVRWSRCHLMTWVVWGQGIVTHVLDGRVHAIW